MAVAYTRRELSQRISNTSHITISTGKERTRHGPHLWAGIHIGRRDTHSARIRHRLHIRARVHRTRRGRHTRHHRLTRIISVRPSVDVCTGTHGSLHRLFVVAWRRHRTLRRSGRLRLLYLALLLLPLLLTGGSVLLVRVRCVGDGCGNVLWAVGVGSDVGAGRVRRLGSLRREELVEALAAEWPHRRCTIVRAEFVSRTDMYVLIALASATLAWWNGLNASLICTG